jgi:hypothetical protein
MNDNTKMLADIVARLDGIERAGWQAASRLGQSTKQRFTMSLRMP